MGRIRDDQAGFSVVEAVLVLVIVALIGVLGFMVYRSHHKSSSNNTATKTTSTTPTTQTTPKSTQQTPSTVKLSADNYSFTAPYGWTKVSPKPQVGNDFTDGKGSTLHVEERYSSSGGGAYGTITADYLWLVKDDSNQGITVVSKSPACTGSTTTFESLSYNCDSNKGTTTVAAFMQAEAGEVNVNGRLYVLEFTNATSGSADTSVFQTALGTFIGGPTK